eukprot:TRINITY_DN25245_c0_g1_i1.p1 TRINITY_DN25245_c0_g1~~TRINITY_DN25245_c0_g1_i1.p1  ORF type:complete len:297 (-),score=34.59 TRINITY_DN25245_c0_g1_i1:2-841(-)
MDVARNVTTLRSKGITHVLTVARECAFYGTLYAGEVGITHKVLPLEDDPTEFILRHFDETYKFIEEGRKQGGVLVHCMAGISRSASVVIAFIMKLNKSQYEETMLLVKKKRGIVFPNEGFQRQLQLYYHMQCNLEGETKFHKMYKTQHFGYLRLRGHHNQMEKMYAPNESAVDPSTLSVSDSKSRLSCKKCRTPLFSNNNVFDHGPLGLSNTSEEECPSYFVEPLLWMRFMIDLDEGELVCPHCSEVVGCFRWKGKRCEECNAKVKPAFMIHKSSVQLG